MTTADTATPEAPEVEEHRTLLEVWRELLSPASTNSSEPLSLQWAVRLKDKYPHLTFPELDDVRQRYFVKLNELVKILLAEIATDAECLTHTTVETDASENAPHYKNLLLQWQQCFILWEHEWSAVAPDAAIEAAAIAEIHVVFFGPTGLLGHLDSIQFEYTEADQQELGEALGEFRESLKAGSSE